MTEQISHYRKYFNIDEDVAYLNSAYMGLLPKESVLRGSQGFELKSCLLYTSPSPRDRTRSRMPSSA